MCNIVRWLVAALLVLSNANATGGPREQAKRIHDRLTGVPASSSVLDQMTSLMAGGGNSLDNAELAAQLAQDHPDFYRTVVKNFSTPWTNRDGDIFAPLNDYTATVIGLVRDEQDFRSVLTTDVLYVGANVPGAPAYASSNNQHYEYLEAQGIDLGAVLEPRPQSALNAIPDSAAAGVLTSRAAARSFFIAGTNRAMFRFALMNHLCVDLEQVADITRPPDRIRQDVTRSPGGDSRLFRNNCVGCHSGMDPMAQAFASYNFAYDAAADPEGESGQLEYNDAGEVDASTGTRVVAKYHFNANNFLPGFVTPDDTWQNYWRTGRNRDLGWASELPGNGSGARSLGEELAGSEAFASCQVRKVVRQVCLREPEAGRDEAMLADLTDQFQNSGFNLKRSFARAAAWCRGE